MCITNPLKISDFQGNLLHMLLFSPKHAFYFSILRIKEGLSHVQQPLLLFIAILLCKAEHRADESSRNIAYPKLHPLAVLYQPA